MENGLMICILVQEIIYGQMEINTVVNGKIIKDQEKEYFIGNLNLKIIYF